MSDEVDRLRREVARGGDASVVARLLMKLQRDGDVQDDDLSAIAHGLEAWVVVEIPRDWPRSGVVESAVHMDERIAYLDALDRALQDPSLVGRPYRGQLRDTLASTRAAVQSGRYSVGVASMVLDGWNDSELPDGPRVIVERTRIR